MKEIVSVELMRKSDFSTIDSGISGKELMYRAAKGVYENVSWSGKVGIVCGSGNNAGDGYALALILKENHICCDLILINEDKFSSDGKYYFHKCLDAKISTLPLEKCDFKSYDMLVDCIFGTGFKGDVSGKEKDAVKKINESGAYTISVDINSGLNGDNGMCSLAVKSDITVSIGSLKSGHYLGMAKDYIKNVVNCDIGISLTDKAYRLMEPADCADAFKERENFSNKGSFGYVALIGGCMEYSGAVKLANLATSSLKSGGGVVKLATARSLYPSVSPYLLESTFYPLDDNDGAIEYNESQIDSLINGVSAVAIGMGMGNTENVYKIIARILKNSDISVIIDADGLNALSKYGVNILKETRCKVVLTPHPKEFERLSGIPVKDILMDPLECAKNFAKEYGCVLLLKGASTVITDGYDVIISDSGCGGMATAGSGDVLSGILLGILGQRSEKCEMLVSVAAGAYINGRAGEIAQTCINPVSMVASDTVNAIGRAVSEILQS
ncbi:MAG: NAD(P)H-hydrate dehydratase [Clostridia bacterium]|nr:NAD(P)H-hydrate dehydratase [Clostridia bacterium]